jgi:hypothetical protein
VRMAAFKYGACGLKMPERTCLHRQRVRSARLTSTMVGGPHWHRPAARGLGTVMARLISIRWPCFGQRSLVYLVSAEPRDRDQGRSGVEWGRSRVARPRRAVLREFPPDADTRRFARFDEIVRTGAAYPHSRRGAQ